MKESSRIITAVAVFALAVCLSPNNLAQNREKFTISAKAGGVNSVMGNVMLSRTGQSEQLLTSQDDLGPGDVVTTGSNSQAEILLNPGSYLRLGPDSMFTLVDNSLDHLVLKLKSGSAIIEATGPDNAKFQINIGTRHEQMAIVRSGIYRVNVSADSTELLVRKGRVQLSDGQLIKGGKKVTFSGGQITIAKRDKHDVDSFDEWSKQRAETLAQANRKLSNRVFNGYLSNNSLFDWWFSARNSWGIWTYSSFSRCYTFLPFYYGWSSPYGNYYGNYFNYYYFPRRGSFGNGPVISNNPPSPSGGTYGGPLVGPTNPGSGPGPGSSGSTAPSIRPPTQAGPRDPDSGSRALNRVKDPD